MNATPLKIKISIKCSSCTLYIVLFSIIFTINIGIGTYFDYCKYMIVIKKMFLDMIMSIKQEIIININEKIQANRDRKSNLLFLKSHDQF